MKLNIAYPVTACGKQVEIDDDRKLRIFYDKRIGQEVDADALGDEWKGYLLRVTGGNDKQGFPMLQGVLSTNRVRLLLAKGSKCFRPRREGQRKRKSVRGCIVDANLSALNLIIVKKGDQEIPGLTETAAPRRLGPRIASKIRKLFNLSKEDDVKKYVIPRIKTLKSGKKITKKPRVQRLVTPEKIRRRKRIMRLKQLRRDKRRDDRAEYMRLLQQRLKEARERMERKRSRMRAALLAKAAKAAKAGRTRTRSSSTRMSTSKPGTKLPTKLGKVVKPTTSAAPAKPGKPQPPKKGGKDAKPATKPGQKGGKPAAKQQTKTTKPTGKPAAAKGGKPAAGKPSGAKPSGGKPAGGKPSGGKPSKASK